MNKIYFVLGLFIFPIVSQATEISILRKNKHGYTNIDIFQQKKEGFYIDGKLIGKTLPPEITKKWNLLSSGIAPEVQNKKAPQQSIQCYAGQYEISIRGPAAEKPILQKGCAEGEQYGKYIANVYELRTFAKSTK